MDTPVTDTIIAEAAHDQLDRPTWLPRDVWPFALRRHRATVDGEVLDVHYTDEGDGPALVLVHAGFWSFVWRDLITELRHDFRCITLDLPGAGLSDGDEDAIDLAAYPAVVESLLDTLGVETATLVIHDLGGVVGVLAAGRRPERIVGMAAVNTFAWRPELPSLRTMLAVVGNPVVTATLGTLRVVPRVSSTRFGVGRDLEPSGRRAFLGPYRDRARARGFHRTMRSAARSAELFEETEHILATELTDRPVLTVFGEHNDPFGFADRWHSLFPDAGSWVVAGGYHFPMCDDAAGLSARLREWHAAEVATAAR